MRKLLVLLLALVMIVAVFAQEAAQAEEAPAITLEDVAKDVEALKDDVASLKSDVAKLKAPTIKFSGAITVKPVITYDASSQAIDFKIGYESWLFPWTYFRIKATSKDEKTGFDFTISPALRYNFETDPNLNPYPVNHTNPPLSNDQLYGVDNYYKWSLNPVVTFRVTGYVWQKLFETENFSVKFDVGRMSKGFYLASGSNFSWEIDPPSFTARRWTEMLDVVVDTTAGDLKNSLTVFAYPAAAPYYMDAGVYDKLTFQWLTLEVFADKIVTTAASTTAFPTLAVGASVDLAKALAIENATLKGFGYIQFDIGSATSVLKQYLFGLDFGYDKFSGSIALDKNNLLGIALSTSALAPVTIGGDVVLDITDPDEYSLVGYADWNLGLLNHRISMTYDAAKLKAKISWRLSVAF